MAIEFYEVRDITEIEDRLRTVLENLRAVRECAEQSDGKGINVQLASCNPLLDRLEKLTFNASAKAKRELYDERRAKLMKKTEDAKQSADEKPRRKR